MFPRILIVEDDPDTAQCFAKLLTMSGYYVRVATGFRSALSLADRECFDLLVCDIGLPDGLGLELMQMLSAKYGMRGIAISGFGEPQIADACMKAGFSAHILKPTTFEHILDVIQIHLLPPHMPAMTIAAL